jgi:putative transposase
MRKSGEKAMSDERILGGDEFVREVLGETEGRMDVVVPKHEQLQQFSEAIEQACKSADISIAFLRSGSKGDVFAKTEKRACRKRGI